MPNIFLCIHSWTMDNMAQTVCRTCHTSHRYFKTGTVEDTMSNKYARRMRSTNCQRHAHAQLASTVIHYKAASSCVSFHLQPFWQCWELWDAAAPGLYRLWSLGFSPWRPLSDLQPFFHVCYACLTSLSEIVRLQMRCLSEDRTAANVSCC